MELRQPGPNESPNQRQAGWHPHWEILFSFPSLIASVGVQSPLHPVTVSQAVPLLGPQSGRVGTGTRNAESELALRDGGPGDLDTSTHTQRGGKVFLALCGPESQA